MIPIEKNIDNLHKVSVPIPNDGKMAENIKSVLLKTMVILGKEALGIAWIQLKRSLPSDLPMKAYREGKRWRAFAIKLQNGTTKAFINPIIRLDGTSKRIPYTEQCLSVKGNYKVGRFEEVMLFWSEPVVNFSKPVKMVIGAKRELYPGLSEANNIVLTGRDAMVAQHEMDHLDGILISDRGEKVI